MSDSLPPFEFYAGVFDSLARVHFNVNRDGEIFHTRPSLRVRNRDDDDMLPALIADFLDEHDIRFDIIERKYGYDYLEIPRRTDIAYMADQFEGISTQLNHELAFVTGPYQERFNSQLSPAEAYQLVQGIEALRFGQRISPKLPYPDPDELAEEFSLDTPSLTPPEIPTPAFPEEYPVEYVAGVIDALGYFAGSVSNTQWGIGYGLTPQLRIYRSGVHPTFAASVTQFCEIENIDCATYGGINKLNVIFNGVSSIDEITPVIGPYVVSFRDELAYVQSELLPEFRADTHRTKQGFYDLLFEFEALPRGPLYRQPERTYTPSYFKKEWAGEIESR